MITARPALLDTCVLINLLATERVSDIVRSIAPSCLVCSAVCAESLYLRTPGPEGKPEPVNLAPLLEAGVLVPCKVEGTDEEDLYVSYALELDDGEPMSLAIAQARHLALATDERKARRLGRENAPYVAMISTAEIIHAWTEGKQAAETISVLWAIATRARFRPPDSDPLAAWWNTLLNE